MIVFIAHTPLYYALEPLLRSVVHDYATQVTIEFFMCLPVLALLPEAVRAVIRPTELREPWLAGSRGMNLAHIPGRVNRERFQHSYSHCSISI